MQGRENIKSNNTAQYYPHGDDEAVATVQGSNGYRISLTMTESGWDTVLATLGEDLGDPRLFVFNIILNDAECQRQTVKSFQGCSVTVDRNTSNSPGISSEPPAATVNLAEIQIMAQRRRISSLPLPTP